MKKMNIKNLKNGPGNLVVITLVGLGVLMLLAQFIENTHFNKKLSYSEFVKKVELDQISSLTVTGNEVQGIVTEKSPTGKEIRTHFATVVPHNAKLWNSLLKDHKVDVTGAYPSADFGIWNILLLAMLGSTIMLVWFFFKQARGANGSNGNNIFSISKSKAKLFNPAQIKVTFDSVAGAKEAKEELYDVVDYLKNPEKYKRLGAKLTRGVLLVGEPGNGKTLLAKAVAGEANCPFFSVSGSDFIEVFVGVGAGRVRDLFAQARKNAPSIIFIDEIDAVGRQRGSGQGGGHDEREQTLNQLLTEMDGFDTGTGIPASVIVIAATNRADVLDKALLRPGRFDRRVEIPFPDLVSREEILRVHAQDVKMDTTINFNHLARCTPGFSGADLANLINEAAINASKHNQDKVYLKDIDEARDKMMLGKEMKTRTFTDEERKITAYHEAGHTLVRLLLHEECDPLHKVTIVPRGRALGVTHFLPERDKHSMSKVEMVGDIMAALGGRAAEELVFNKLATGASSDFARATEIAQQMVRFYGMSKTLGLVAYTPQGPYGYSEETARLIDHEIRSIMQECYDKVLVLLADNKDKLYKLAEMLLEKETLYADEIYELLDIPARASFRLQ
ncbi:ATP-dependent metallopeptidase FtsH/Yme1/Tma family protein [Candidatus Dependentiae bacterium]|nr:ATP-dependent metallopeptidase FtsH/Yme1/Tma family protein [Candidatus Dependentiae bacterium]